MNQSRYRTEHLFQFLCFALTLGIQLWYILPLDEWIIGHDAIYHHLRVDAVVERLRFGDFLSEVNHVYFQGAGYADFAYPTTLLYIPALFRLLGCGIGASMGLFLMLCCVFTYAAAFAAVKDITGSPIAGTIAAVLYSLSQYRLDCLFTRFALGEVQAFLFWPLVLWGMYDLIARDAKRLWPLGVGLGGMLLSHSLSTLLACVVCAVLCLVFFKRIHADKEKWLRLSITAGLTMALTAFYWIPFLRFILLHDAALFHPVTTAENNLVDPLTMFSNVGIGATHAGIGTLLLFASASRVFLGARSPLACEMRRDGLCVRFFDACLLTGLIALFCATDRAPWKLLGVFFNSLQFSFRLYAVVTACLAIAGGIFLYYALHGARVKRLGMLLLCAACLLSASLHFKLINPAHAPSPSDDYYYATDASRSVGNAEWLPIEAKYKVAEWETKTDLLELSDGTRPTYTRARDTFTFPVDTPCTHATLPLVWYHDYIAFDEQGNRLPVSADEQGLVRVDLTDVTGTVTVTYAVSFATKAAFALSTITLLSLLTVLTLLRMRRKKETPQESSDPTDFTDSPSPFIKT